ncbi:MAG: type II secretion system protein [Opitutae bacterium]|nr:type II secretion system protein [Opitutae bacterium]
MIRTAPVAPAHPGRRLRAGFSLIELMVVLGIITLLLAAVGVALRGSGSQAAALQTAQSRVASLLGMARSQAAIYQVRARLVVYAIQPPSGESDKYLRYLLLVRETAYNSSAWVAVGEPAYLPSPIYVVPPSVPTNHLALDATGRRVVWPGTAYAPVSSISGTTSMLVRYSENSPTTVNLSRVYYIEYTPDGRTTSTKIALATAQPADNTTAHQYPMFDNPSAVRGLLLRSTGTISFVNDANSF